MDYIYSYCWLFLDIDLKILREELAKLRSPLIFDNIGIRDDAKQRCLRAINSKTEAKFEKLSVWLQKPNNVSPTTSLNLLFNAVVNEIKEQNPDFAPSISMHGDIDINLHGHGYHFFYDILQILVSNVAKHGKKKSNLIFSFEPDSSGESILKITSEVNSDLGLEDKIKKSFEADITDAMSVSGDSGIKKLRVLERDTKEIISIKYKIQENQLSAIVRLKLQRT